MLDYLLWRAGSMGKGVGRAALLRSVVASSAVLEAFGNAATGLNHNSSRFGKFLRLRLTADGRVDGAELSSYLLEKSRLAATPQAERNFHALHYLAAAAAALAPLGLARRPRPQRRQPRSCPTRAEAAAPDAATSSATAATWAPPTRRRASRRRSTRWQR